MHRRPSADTRERQELAINIAGACIHATQPRWTRLSFQSFHGFLYKHMNYRRGWQVFWNRSQDRHLPSGLDHGARGTVSLSVLDEPG